MMRDDVIDELEAWGSYMRGGAVQLGFSKESLESKMMRYGPDSLIRDCKKRPATDSFVPERVMRTEKILLAMPEYDRRLVVIAYTVMVSRQRQSEILSSVIGRKISRRQYMIDLEAAHKWYGAYTQALRENNLQISVDECAQESV